MELISDIHYLLYATLLDVLPIAVIIFGFQFLVIRKRIVNLKDGIIIDDNTVKQMRAKQVANV